jgi:hypothetical protein
MKPKTTKILYWVFLILIAAFSVFDGIGGITREAHGVQSITQLGYPVYLMQFLGAAKLLGVIAILQTKFNTIKEWAYAGFAFTFIGAFASRAFVGDSGLLLVLPLIMLAIMFVPYFIWKAGQNTKALSSTVNRAFLRS